MINIGVFLSESFQFLEVKFSICLNRRVFVMIESFYMQHCSLRGCIRPSADLSGIQLSK